MANIKVVYDGLFIGVPGLYHEVLSLDEPTVDKLIQALVQKHGTRFKDMLYEHGSNEIAPQVAVLVNGSRPGPQARLNEADEVAFLVPIAGGALSALSRAKVFRAIKSRCSACLMCELTCSLNKTGITNPALARIKIIASDRDFTNTPIICHHCKNAPCQAACPVPEAMVQDTSTGAWAISEKKCIACLACVDACPFGAIRVGPNREVLKCDLCGGDPICVKYCPPRPLPLPEQSALQYVEPHTVIVGQRATLANSKH